MYVCLCHGVTEDDLEEWIGSGSVGDFSDLQRKSKAGTDCGTCTADLLEKCETLLKNRVTLEKMPTALAQPQPWHGAGHSEPNGNVLKSQEESTHPSSDEPDNALFRAV